jgi:hypothetical protein
VRLVWWFAIVAVAVTHLVVGTAVEAIAQHRKEVLFGIGITGVICLVLFV